ncbi:MAG TPA: isoprenylcysteine carboxylmethyltransferase family protein [Terriglobales bacterium]|nr:isoprenylcysteine carboxylmethyltransferase family protein [Terriglobales bacterium]
MTSYRIFRELLQIPWIIFALYWLVSAFKTRRTRKSESLLSRYGVMLIVACGFVFLFDSDSGAGWLRLRFASHDLAVEIAGVALTWLGIGLTLWARFHLGENWSAKVTIKEGHELIRSGPYAHLRHPIYSGLLLAVAGSALEIGEVRCLIGMAIIAVGFSIKARKEESMLREQFGSAFDEHRKHTGFLLPRFR